jgi:protease II
VAVRRWVLHWYEDGKKMMKKKTPSPSLDFIDCAEYLVATKHTSTKTFVHQCGVPVAC